MDKREEKDEEMFKIRIGTVNGGQEVAINKHLSINNNKMGKNEIIDKTNQDPWNLALKEH